MEDNLLVTLHSLLVMRHSLLAMEDNLLVMHNNLLVMQDSLMVMLDYQNLFKDNSLSLILCKQHNLFINDLLSDSRLASLEP